MPYPIVAYVLLLVLCPTIAAGASTDLFDFDLNAAAPSQVDDRWRIAGFAESRLQYTQSGDWLSRRHAGQIEVRYQHRQWRSFVAGRVQYDGPTRSYSTPLRSELVEAYITHAGQDRDITLGKQRVAWGTADGVSTIDRVNAIDLRDPVGNARTASRRPSWLVKWRQKVGAGDLEAVWLPRGRDRKLPEFGSPWEPSSLHTLRAGAKSNGTVLDIRDFHRPEGGLRYTVYGRGVDWGVALFEGYTDAPVILAATPDGLRLSPEKIRTWNVNTAFAYAGSTFRAEIAYTPQLTTAGTRSKLVQAVVGWDRTFFANLYINVQLFADRFTSIDRTDQGITFAVTNKTLNDSVTYGTRGQVTSGAQSAVEVFADYNVNDAWLLSLRTLKFSGRSGTALDDFDNNDLVELTARWSF